MQPFCSFQCQQNKLNAMRPIGLFVILSSAIVSCVKDTPVKTQTLLPCDLVQTLDSTAIFAKLAGTWIWKKQSIPYTNSYKYADKIIKVTFNTDSTFTLADSATVLDQGSWKLIFYGEKNYSLQTDSYNNYIGGAIYFCDNQVLFMASIYDGTDNVFEKIN